MVHIGIFLKSFLGKIMKNIFKLGVREKLVIL